MSPRLLDSETDASRGLTRSAALVLFSLAVVVGLPSLRGGFLAGDDYHLVLNHVLVNHPSWSHAWEILTIVHRDLYQPIPLLLFSLDFVIINAFGLLPTTEGPHAGAWVFHLTNVLIHGVNAVLVLYVMRRYAGGLGVAAVAACLFAIHPLAAEPIAWLNGRMMMLSACFTLATILAFERWSASPSIARAACVLLFTFAAHMSKVSVALPVLVALGALARRRVPAMHVWAMWVPVCVISGLFTLYNIHTSEEMFHIAEGQMQGSRFLYCMLALGQYFGQYVVPLGLSIWYPPPVDLAWTQPDVVVSIIIVALVAALTLLSLRHTYVGALGMLWFMSAVFPTLPIVPARRAVGADRYVYLPMIGLAWIAAAALVAMYQHLRRRGDASGTGPRWLFVPGAAVAVVFVGLSWQTQGYHRTDVDAALRNIETNPDVPGVYEQAAWAYYRHGQYENAIDIAQEDIQRHPETMACEAYQVIGMSQFRLGRYEEALTSLEKAIEADPEYGKCYSRLGQILAHLGRHEEAIANYERAIEIMPFYNPGLLSLASLYRTVGRVDDAVRTYETVLEYNPYDVSAQLALSEIAISRGRFDAAAERLEKLLSWMPENTVARTNLALAYEGMGRIEDAEHQYEECLRHEPAAVVASVNLANLYLRTNRVDAAGQLYDRALAKHATDPTVLMGYHDFAMAAGRLGQAANRLLDLHRRRAGSAAVALWAAYTLAQSGRVAQADAVLLRVPSREHRALALLTRVSIALARGHVEPALQATRGLLAAEDPALPDARARLLANLQRAAAARPDDPWPYCLTAVVLDKRRDDALARRAIEECVRRCPDASCRQRAEQLLPSAR